MHTLMWTHASHQGTEACVQQAWDVMFWPGMASKIRLKKVNKDNLDMSLVILAWRKTTTEGGNYSPAQKL